MEIFTIDRNNSEQVESLIGYMASIIFVNTICEVCKRPILSNGIMLDGAIRTRGKCDELKWSHRACYHRNN